MENYCQAKAKFRPKPAFLSDFWNRCGALALAAALSVGTTGRPAAAQPGFENVAPTDTTEPKDKPEPKGKKKKKKKKPDDGANGKRKKNAVVSPAGHVEIKGRVVARSEMRAQRATIVGLDGRSESGLIKSHDLSVATARLSLHYESPAPWLTGVVEFELAGKPDLKDGYVQAKLDGFGFRAGQFKMPSSPQESVSPSALPTVHRGFTSQLLTDWLDVGGRRPGFMASYHPPSQGIRPGLSLGAFQSSTVVEVLPGDRDTDRISFKSLSSQSLIARAQLETPVMAAGIWYEHRLGSPRVNEARRYSTAGADVTWDAGDHAGGLRAWLSGVVGESWYRHTAVATLRDTAVFATGRLLVGYRLFGTERDMFYLEPFGFCGVFDPDLKLNRDLALETAVGLNVGLWRRTRFTLQLESVVADTYFPKGSQGFLGGEDPRRESLYAQVMLVF
ncbi:MAG: hypothetical protein ACOY0T_36410 [Myxococcota bacterium]